MPDADRKYRAFLSYSHADTAVAQRVHRRLEGFHIDKELVGRVTPAGMIPKTLRPVFRDRNDFDAGSSLGAETDTALDDSAALILLASAEKFEQHFRQLGGAFFRDKVAAIDRFAADVLNPGAPYLERRLPAMRPALCTP